MARENLMNNSHKATNDNFRRGYDNIEWDLTFNEALEKARREERDERTRRRKD